MKLKATVLIEKSFDKSKTFSKEWMPRDFENFFEEEGCYLDRLAIMLEDKGKNEDEFTITYTVKIVKQN